MEPLLNWWNDGLKDWWQAQLPEADKGPWLKGQPGGAGWLGCPALIRIHHAHNEWYFKKKLPKARLIQELRAHLGTGHATKLDEFSERFQTAVDPHPHPSEWSLSLEIMCMHFILSGPRTFLHIYSSTISIIEIRNIIFRKWGGGRGSFGIFLKIHRIWRSHPSISPKIYHFLLPSLDLIPGTVQHDSITTLSVSQLALKDFWISQYSRVTLEET